VLHEQPLEHAAPQLLVGLVDLGDEPAFEPRDDPLL
jgi:hypothetical protein